MLYSRALTYRGAVSAGIFSNQGISRQIIPLMASFSTSAVSRDVPKKKKKEADITQIPIQNLGVLAPYYVPPPIFSSPITSWYKLVFRRMGQFLFNTYSVYKFKNETGKNVQFNKWKDDAIDIFVKTNKAFASNNLSSVRSKVGVSTLDALAARENSLPKYTKLDWELIKIEENPKVVCFNAIPDGAGVTAMVQFVMKLKTNQRVVVTPRGEEPTVTERKTTDYLVYTLNPLSDEICLVGTLFECDHLRPIQPDLDSVSTYKQMMDFQKECADIFRSKK